MPSFLAAFTGRASGRETSRAGAAIADNLGKARIDQTAALDLGRTRGLADLTGGYDRAVGALGQGTTQARTDLGTGFERGRNALTELYTGPNGAEARINQGRDNSLNILAPYLTRQNQYSGELANATGMNGTASRDASMAAFFGGQDGAGGAFKYANDLVQQRIAADMNAKGRGNSGKAILAGTRAGQESNERRFNDWMGRVERNANGPYVGMGIGVESDAAGRVANIRTGLGDRLNQSHTGEGQGYAELDTRNANTLAELGYRFGSDKAGANRWAAGGTSDIIGNNVGAVNNNVNQTAANRDAARTAGFNNLISVGALAARAAGAPALAGAAGGAAAGGLSTLYGGYNTGGLSGMGGSLATGNYGNVGQSRVDGYELPRLGGMFR